MGVLVWIIALAAVAEAFRYGLLLWNQSHLVRAITVAIADAASFVLGALAPVMVLLAAISCAAWLVHARAEFYASKGLRDPRSARSVFLGVLIPGWNLLMPGVFLTELATLREPVIAAAGGEGLPPAGSADTPALAARFVPLRAFGEKFQRPFASLSALSLVRVWWGMWVLTNITVVGLLLTRFDSSMQARADGVLFTLYANVLALAVAGLTIKLMARFDGRPTAQGSDPARWLIAS